MASRVVPGRSSTSTRSSPSDPVQEAALPRVRSTDERHAGGRVLVVRKLFFAVRKRFDESRFEVARCRDREARSRGRSCRRRGDRDRRRPRPRAESRPCSRRRRPPSRSCGGASTAARSASVGPVVASATKMTASASRDGRENLTRDAGLHRIVVLRVEPARVDERVPLAERARVGVLAVARDARLVVDDRDARSREAVEERRLADVWAAHDGDDGRAA